MSEFSPAFSKTFLDYIRKTFDSIWICCFGPSWLASHRTFLTFSAADNASPLHASWKQHVCVWASFNELKVCVRVNVVSLCFCQQYSEKEDKYEEEIKVLTDKLKEVIKKTPFQQKLAFRFVFKLGFMVLDGWHSILVHFEFTESLLSACPPGWNPCRVCRKDSDQTGKVHRRSGRYEIRTTHCRVSFELGHLVKVAFCELAGNIFFQTDILTDKVSKAPQMMLFFGH